MSIFDNTNGKATTATQKALTLHAITLEHGITYKQILERVNEERSKKGIQPLSYKSTVNRLALLRDNKYVSFSRATLDSFVKAAFQLVEQQTNEPQP